MGTPRVLMGPRRKSAPRRARIDGRRRKPNWTPLEWVDKHPDLIQQKLREIYDNAKERRAREEAHNNLARAEKAYVAAGGKLDVRHLEIRSGLLTISLHEEFVRIGCHFADYDAMARFLYGKVTPRTKANIRTMMKRLRALGALVDSL